MTTTTTDKMTVHDVAGESSDWPAHQRHHIECLVQLETVQEVSLEFINRLLDLLTDAELLLIHLPGEAQV